MSHTPGPWTYYPPIMDDKTGVIINVGAREESIIATLHHPLGEGETLDANARLIAAAPDLLLCLKMLIIDMEHLVPDGNTTIAMAKEAIRKARAVS